LAEGGDLSAAQGRAVCESVTRKGKEQLEELIFLPLQKGYSKHEVSGVCLRKPSEGAGESQLLPQSGRLYLVINSQRGVELMLSPEGTCWEELGSARGPEKTPSRTEAESSWRGTC